MTAFLYRVGRFAYRRRWLVLLVWLAVVGGVLGLATQAPPAPTDTNAIPGTEFQKANDLLTRAFHADPNGATAQLVFVAPPGRKVTDQRYRSVIDQAVTEAGRSPQAINAADPFEDGTVSPDGSTAIATVDYRVASDDLTTATKQTLHDAVRRGHDAGLSVEVGGDALHVSASDTTLLISLGADAVILLLTFGALAAAGLPLLTAFLGVGLSLSGIIALSSTLGLAGTAQQLGLMLGLAVGIDYALFIVFRYREERGKGREPREAAALATGTAGSAVVFAGLTVIIALAGLSVIGIPNVTKMGLAAAATVAVAVFIAVTLIPALLGFFPRAVLPRRRRREPVVGHGRPNLGSRWAGFVLRRPLPVLLVSVAALGVIALPATHLRLGESGNAILPTSSTQRRAYDDISRAFGPGYNGTLAIVVTTAGAPDPKAAAATVADHIRDTPGVAAVSPPRFDQAGDVAVISAVPATAPDAARTATLVQDIRDQRTAITAATGASYLVTGLTAANIDIAKKVTGALIPYLLAVVGLAFLLLLVVFRSVLVPLKATLGFVLSLLAGLGALVAVFQWGWLGSVLGVSATGPVQSFMPIFVTGIAFGLAMDYEVFVVSRIREAYTHGEPPHAAIVTGFRHSARVVVAAALIMTAVFAGFLGSNTAVIKLIGLGLAVTVVLDAFVVRMIIVPAVLALLGRRAWWLPRWLDRRLPHLDIEGQTLGARPEADPESADPVTVGR